MGGLRAFGSLCAGVAVLVVCWSAALATLAGMMMVQPGRGWWTFLGIPLVLVLLAVGFGLAMAHDEASGSGGTLNALIVFFLVACGALMVAGGVAYFSGAQVYQAHLGTRAEAVISSTIGFNGESGGVVRRWYYVDDAVTGESLGPLATPPENAEEGTRVTVLVDPHGWIRPVPADSAARTAAPTAIALGAAGVVLLGALAVLATGLWASATRRPR
ncbi:hypothetical protein ACWEFJ_00745 [Actinosynnema sp. NPDC004786]